MPGEGDAPASRRFGLPQRAHAGYMVSGVAATVSKLLEQADLETNQDAAGLAACACCA